MAFRAGWPGRCGISWVTSTVLTTPRSAIRHVDLPGTRTHLCDVITVSGSDFDGDGLPERNRRIPPRGRG
jgi:hypothetical protein